MSWLLDQLGSLLLLVLLLIVVMALLAPFETLGWWAGWSPRDLEHDPPQPAEPAAPDHAEQPPHAFVVYLTGVGGFSGAALRESEARFVESLAARLPRAAVIRDVFPYSVNNNPLDGHRVMSTFWRWLQQNRLKMPNSIFDLPVILHNVMQVGVSSDPRYGPVYNLGVAREVVQSLMRHGYATGAATEITLVGYSGGAQISIAIARYLTNTLRASVRVISLGGVFSSDPALTYVDHIYHFEGQRDPMPRLGVVLYPGRWPVMATSAWNAVKRKGRVTTIRRGLIAHFGAMDYFSESATLPDGRTHLEQTVEHVAAIVESSP